jgi:hypothetical protein
LFLQIILYSKNTLLPHGQRNLNLLIKGFFLLCTNFKFSKILLCPWIKQNSLYAFRDLLILSHWFICYIQGYRGLFSNSIFIFNIKSQKSCCHMLFTRSRVGGVHALSTARTALLCQKIVFHRVTKSTATCYSSCCGACRWWTNDLSLVIVSSFFFLFFFLF